jgi:hypothetical protein
MQIQNQRVRQRQNQPLWEGSERGRKKETGADLEVLFSWSAVASGALDLALRVGEHGPPPAAATRFAPPRRWAGSYLLLL